MRKKVAIKYPDERIVLSDVLPYETTLIFSNRYFYKYLLKRKKSQSNPKFKLRHNKAYSQIESLLFHSEEKNNPFKFSVNHKKNDFRELSIIHPANQVKIIEFYKEYRSLILYYSSLSPFSIRKPSSVANFVFYNDLLHKKDNDGDLEFSQIEQDSSEYENLKSYFTYYKYSNIHRFFESYQFHRSEKKYSKLLKIDISKCFDSVYTHSIAWALYNKPIIKENIEDSSDTFAGKFDYLMQKLNANETNGIVIGPEFSRIFAELILQQIDINIYQKLKKEDNTGKALIHKVDYEIFRYIDDYFIFYNHDIDAERILKQFKLCLSEYKLYINDNKSITYNKPIITEISLAKLKITDLFSEHIRINDNASEKDNSTLYFSSNKIITRFKAIIKETNVEYKDIMNYSLAVLDRKTGKLISSFKDLKGKKNDIEFEIEKAFLEILDIAFFLYSVSPKVNSTIRLCILIDKIISFLKKNRVNGYIEPFQSNNKHNVFKKISDEIFLILQKNRTTQETQIETLYLLIAISQLGKEYRLNLKNLCSYFNIELNNNKISFKTDLNYFSITTLLFYIKNIYAYDKIKLALKGFIFEKFNQASVDPNWKKNAELVFLLMDCITCPYLNDSVTHNEKTDLVAIIDIFHLEIIKPIEDLDIYLNNCTNALLNIYSSDTFKNKINKNSAKKIGDNFKLFKEELKSKFNTKAYKYQSPSKIYHYESTLINEIYTFKNVFKNTVDKYKYKKQLLNLLKITENQTNLIEQEKFWFIRWSDFDFKMELQAKRSQEVY